MSSMLARCIVVLLAIPSWLVPIIAAADDVFPNAEELDEHDGEGDDADVDDHEEHHDSELLEHPTVESASKWRKSWKSELAFLTQRCPRKPNTKSVTRCATSSTRTLPRQSRTCTSALLPSSLPLSSGKVSGPARFASLC
eukprot:TRINITY_DN9643_c0_g1_i1.p1 TRINITY_DN9643_c0_g1~~TRINITY_DN9643_c0_g1_i1.p1  ORF type:complete len:140 (-),score=26.86 TRINITY_DN9643_c0_g1_i1:93-512(-)